MRSTIPYITPGKATLFVVIRDAVVIRYHPSEEVFAVYHSHSIKGFNRLQLVANIPSKHREGKGL